MRFYFHVFLLEYLYDSSKAVSEYYTIDTLFLSLADTTPPCLHREENPVSKIRASLFMLYVLFFVLTFTVQV